MIRYSKILCVMAVALYCFLVVMGNSMDYSANFPGVARTLMVTDKFPDSNIGYRAISNPLLHHLAFLLIIGLEALTAALCILGAWILFKARHADSKKFNQSKRWAIAGLTCGFLTWQVLFFSVAGEWFGAWMSVTLRGSLTSAFQIYMTLLGVLIYLSMNDE